MGEPLLFDGRGLVSYRFEVRVRAGNLIHSDSEVYD